MQVRVSFGQLNYSSTALACFCCRSTFLRAGSKRVKHFFYRALVTFGGHVLSQGRESDVFCCCLFALTSTSSLPSLSHSWACYYLRRIFFGLWQGGWWCSEARPPLGAANRSSKQTFFEPFGVNQITVKLLLFRGILYCTFFGRNSIDRLDQYCGPARYCLLS